MSCSSRLFLRNITRCKRRENKAQKANEESAALIKKLNDERLALLAKIDKLNKVFKVISNSF